MRKKFLPKLLIASVLAGGVNFVPSVVNFNAENLQIISVAQAEVQNVTASDTAIFDFGEDDAQIVNTVKNVAKMRAIQAVKEKAGIFVKSQTKTVNCVLTDDDISAYTSNNITILDVQYKKVPVQAQDVKGNDTGKIAFMYEATVTAKVDTSGLTAYIQRDYEERQKIVQQNNSSQENISKISNDFDNLRNSSEDVNQVRYKFNQVDNEILVQQKNDEGNEFAYQKNYQSAISKYNEAIKLNPNYAETYFNRGVVYDELKNYQQAIFDYTKAIELNQNDTDAYNNRGTIYYVLGNYEQAISDYNQAIKLNPNYEFAYNNRGVIYDKFENYEQAISDYNQAIKLNHNNVSAYNNRGLAYANLKNYQQAIKDLTMVIKINPNHSIAYQARGICYRALGKNAEAEKDFAKAKELGYDF